MENSKAICRACKKELEGKPYSQGGFAYFNGKQCKVNYYGGFVCSKQCDYRASLELEQSMPGHGCTQTRLTGNSMKSYERNWNE
jgi:hypothetical protein